MAMDTCPKCGSTNIDHGVIVSAGKISYRSSKQRLPFVNPNTITYACLNCGYTETYVDLKYRDKVKRM